MEKLVILDYSTAEVHFFTVDSEAVIDEDYLRKLGFHPSMCSYMFSKNLGIKSHTEILK